MNERAASLILLVPAAILAPGGLSGILAAPADSPQWGERHSRNMVSDETGLPSSIDPATGTDVLWTASLGNGNWGSPVIARGRVLIGANNHEPRDPRHQGDRANLLCLDEKTGDLAWQLVVPRTASPDVFLDWPHVGICSPPTVEGDRAWTVTNRFEVVCLDLDGQADGNDGPYLDEGRHMTPEGSEPLAVTPIDADIIWLLDMPTQVGMYPHDGAHASILLDGRYLYLNTCNGVDNTHVKIRRPDAPSLIVLDKETGRVVARDDEKIGPRIFHSTWSSPALGEVAGQRRIWFCGGDGVCYAFEALRPDAPPPDSTQVLRRVWRFDPDPTAPKENVHEYNQNRRESPSNVKSMPVFVDGKLYVTHGGDIWWGKNQAWLKCIDGSGSGDVTATGLVWDLPLGKHCCSTPSVRDGLAYVADCDGDLYCADARTGALQWKQKVGREVWGSTLVADGKVHVGTREGELWILAAWREKRILCSVDLKGSIPTTPSAANGVLYVATLNRLWALRKGAGPQPPAAASAATAPEPGSAAGR